MDYERASMTNEERELFNNIQKKLGTAIKKDIGDVDIVKITDLEEFCKLGEGHELYRFKSQGLFFDRNQCFMESEMTAME